MALFAGLKIIRMVAAIAPLDVRFGNILHGSRFCIHGVKRVAVGAVGCVFRFFFIMRHIYMRIDGFF